MDAAGWLTAGSVFSDRYEIVRCIRAGGMGAVYEAVHHTTRRRAALKVMLHSLVRDEDLRRRFALEASVTSGVSSEHLVPIYDAGVDAATGLPFIVMELLEGDDLGTVLAQRGRLAPRDVVEYLAQAALGLDRTHAAGIVHRDLKPENLFLCRRDDGSPWIKVLDFGIAKVIATATARKHTRVAGTPVYMAPEQMEGAAHIGPGADVYAVGHIAFTLLVGQPYWWQEFQAHKSAYRFLRTVVRGAAENTITRAARLGVSLPTSFSRWFFHSTAFDPAARYPSMSAQVCELARALALELDDAPPALDPERTLPEERSTAPVASWRAPPSSDPRAPFAARQAARAAAPGAPVDPAGPTEPLAAAATEPHAAGPSRPLR